MDTKTAIAQLRILERLMPEDGWGDHYIQAIKFAADALEFATPAPVETQEKGDQ